MPSQRSHLFEPLESEEWSSGRLVAGVDEAGRGALAGPVVAAAVVLAPDRIPAGINDSKVLSAQRRAVLEPIIKEHALAWCVGSIEQDVIDEINILQATYRAMHAAIDGLVVEPSLLLIDGNRFKPHRIASRTVIDGDARCVSIAAASILAKVERDRWMTTTAHELYPMYGFDRHKGYGTPQHKEALSQYGPCPLHRRSFLSL
jgi:ribonuclease HII